MPTKKQTKPRAAKQRKKTATKRATKPAAKAVAPVAKKPENTWTKSATVLTMIEQGPTMQELMSATGWQAHSVRGFLSRTVRKQLGRTVSLITREDRTKAYQLSPQSVPSTPFS